MITETAAEINSTIALERGWIFDGTDGWTDPAGTYHQALYGTVDKYGSPVPPDYAWDLNELHEFVSWLHDNNRRMYQDYLFFLRSKCHGKHDPADAPAGLRCEAIIEAIKNK